MKIIPVVSKEYAIVISEFFIFKTVLINGPMIIANIFIKITILSLIISSFIVLLSSIYIMITTSNIIHEQNINYISATISLYLNIYNIFISLLYIFNIFSSNKD